MVDFAVIVKNAVFSLIKSGKSLIYYIAEKDLKTPTIYQYNPTMTSTTSTSDALCPYATCYSCSRYCYTGEEVEMPFDWECEDCDEEYEFCDECNETFHQDEFCEHLKFIFAGCDEDEEINPAYLCRGCGNETDIIGDKCADCR